MAEFLEDEPFCELETEGENVEIREDIAVPQLEGQTVVVPPALNARFGDLELKRATYDYHEDPASVFIWYHSPLKKVQVVSAREGYEVTVSSDYMVKGWRQPDGRMLREMYLDLDSALERIEQLVTQGIGGAPMPSPFS